MARTTTEQKRDIEIHSKYGRHCLLWHFDGVGEKHLRELHRHRDTEIFHKLANLDKPILTHDELRQTLGTSAGRYFNQKLYRRFKPFELGGTTRFNRRDVIAAFAEHLEGMGAIGRGVIPDLKPTTMTADEAGSLCRVSGQTWRRWVAQGKAPASSGIGTWKKTDVENWIKTQTQGTKQ